MSDKEDQLQTETTTQATTVHTNGDILHDNSSSTLAQSSSTSGYLTGNNNLRLNFSNINYVYKQSKCNKK